MTIRIGAVTIDTSHPKTYAPLLAADGRARYAAVWNEGFREDDEVEGFIKAAGLERRCRSIEELADCTDAGFIHSCNWEKHLAQAEPFLRRGKPVFVDKPLCGSLADCRRFEALAAKGGVILGASALRYAEEIVSLPREPAEKTGRILHAYGTSGTDEFNYAVHIVEALGGLLGTGARSCRYLGAAEAKEERMRCETYFVRFGPGLTASYTTFLGRSQPFDMVVMTTAGRKTTKSFRIESNSYAALIRLLCDHLAGGPKSIAPVPALTESIRILLAGRLSRETGGAEVGLDEIPEDDPGYDGGAFERGYIAAAKKIYC